MKKTPIALLILILFTGCSTAQLGDAIDKACGAAAPLVDKAEKIRFGADVALKSAGENLEFAKRELSEAREAADAAGLDVAAEVISKLERAIDWAQSKHDTAKRIFTAATLWWSRAVGVYNVACGHGVADEGRAFSPADVDKALNALERELTGGGS